MDDAKAWRGAPKRMLGMWLRRLAGIAAAAFVPLLPALPAAAQAPSSIDIPLQLLTVGSQNSFYRLGINVGINGGAPQRYMFDTGSAPFVAAFNPNTWGGFAGQTTVPNSPYANGNNVFYCYGGNCSSASTTGNFLPIRSLSVSGINFTANPGYAVDAVSQLTIGNSTVNFPNYFTNNPQAAPPFSNAFGPFYGVFGAGNFTQGIFGGVLGQTIVSGAAAQGYVVAANGQRNPASSINAPQQANGINVSVGGQTQAVTSCSPCVTVGLTPQVIGQFAPVGLPATTARAGVVPVKSSNTPFNNPNVPIGSAPGNNGSIQYGANFTVSLVARGASTPAATVTTGTLLDTGTTNFELAEALRQPAVATNGSANAGVTLWATGVTASGASIPGVPTSSAVLTNGGSPNTYNAGFSGTTNILGISFFLQNSVLFDLSDNLVGYTPFFVTDAPLSTTANGPLTVDGTNMPLGLAGVISGPGGVSVNNGGALQLSATNTYSGPTTIAAGGQLFIAGPGSIAASSGVTANGIFDISRAWAPVMIQALSGAGLVSLGGQNLTITNANGVFSGTIADGGAWPAGGGSLTIAGGSQTLSGNSTYSGGTIVAAGALNLTGSIIGGVAVLPGATFYNGGTVQSLGAPVINQGMLINNGQLTANLFNSGYLGGTGTITGNLFNAGLIGPGNSIGTLAVNGNYTQAAGSGFLAEVNAAGQGDRIAVSGTATIQGGTVVALPQASGVYAPRTTYTLVSASGGLSGGYSAVGSSLPFLLPSLSYDANNAYLALTIGGFRAAAQTPLQAAVGAALDASVLQASGDFATVLGTLATLQNAAQVQPVLTSLSGMNYSGFSNSMVQGAQLFMNNFLSQASSANRGTGKVALAEACDVACDTTAPAPWGAWGGALGGLGTVGANQGLGGVTYNVGGFAAGLDRAITGSFRAGVTVGYTAGSQWVSGFSGQGFSNTVQAGLYGGYAQGPVYLDGIVGYAYSANNLSRSLQIPGLAPRLATGQTGANQVYGQAEGGWRFDLGGPLDSFVTPFARLQAYSGTQNAFTESGAQSLDLSVAAQTTNSLRSVLGAQLGGDVDLGWRDKLFAQFRLGWSHEYADVARPVAASFVGAPSAPFTTYGASPQRDGAVVGVAANTAIGEAISLYLRYEGDFSGQDTTHALTAGVRMTW